MTEIQELLAEAFVMLVGMFEPEETENGLKFEADMALTERKITIPTRNEWIGINLLERDDELER